MNLNVDIVREIFRMIVGLILLILVVLLVWFGRVNPEAVVAFALGSLGTWFAIDGALLKPAARKQNGNGTKSNGHSV